MFPASMLEKLHEFETAFPDKSIIKLVDAKKYLKTLIGEEISDEHVMAYLKAKGYQQIQTSAYSEELDLDDILNMDWTSKKNKDTDSIHAQEGYGANARLLNEFHSASEKDADAAFEQLITDNIKLVHKVAKRYLNYVAHSLTYDDLVSEGIIGLIKAIRKFDVNRDVQFSTYAMWWIRQQIIRAIQDTGTTVRIPVHIFDKVLTIKRAEHPFLLEGKTPEVDIICNHLNISRQQYEKAKKVEHQYLGITSLDQNVSNEDHDTSLAEFISLESHSLICGYNEQYFNPSLLVEQKDVRERIFQVIEELKPREQVVIIERFGLRDNNEKTLEEVGKVFGVTRERIRQIEAKALGKLKIRIRRIREDFQWPEQLIGG